MNKVGDPIGVRALIDAYDWSGTELGARERWPQSVTSVVNMMLASPFPMFILWGHSRTLIYNDAYVPLLGRHSAYALGANFFDIWPEVRATIEPIVDHALAGQSSLHADLKVVLDRGSRPEPAWFTFSYSPVFDDTAQVGGVICICFETTEASLAARRQGSLVDLEARLRDLHDTADIIRAAQEIIGTHLGVSRVGYGSVDSTERFFTTDDNWTDGSVPNHNGTHDLAAFGDEVWATIRRGRTLVIGDAASDPKNISPEISAAFEALQIRAVVTVSLVKKGRLVAALYVHDRNPRSWHAGDVAFIQEVAERIWSAVERARAEAVTRESEERLRLALVAGGFTDWYWDRDSDRATFSKHATETLGLPPDFTMTSQQIAAFVLDEDRRRVLKAGERALRSGKPYQIEYRVRTLAGDIEWIATYGRPVSNVDGRVIGVSGLSQIISQRKRSEEALREREEQLSAFVGQTTAGFAQVDLTGRFTLVNDRFCEIAGRRAEELMQMTMQEITHPDDLAHNLPLFEKAVRSGTPYTHEKRYVRPDGSIVWVNNSVAVVRKPDGEPYGVLAVTIDITERRKAEEHRQLLINELNHRVKNTLAVVQSIALQSFNDERVPETAHKAFQGRLHALSSAHNILTRENWEAASLSEIVRDTLVPFGLEDRLHFQGADIRVSPRPAVTLALALHELCTNAVKYGALSNGDGRVNVKNEASRGGDRLFRLVWAEAGGPPVETPSHHGFGSRLIRRGLAAELGGRVEVDFDPAGVTCIIEAPLCNVEQP